MTRKLNIFLVLVLVLAVSASAFANWTGTITLWDCPRWGNEEDDKFHWIKGKIAEFEASHPGVKIELVETPWAELGEKLSVAIAGRAWPTLSPWTSAAPSTAAIWSRALWKLWMTT